MRDLNEIISRMTLEEKAGMCSGEDFWQLKGIERLGIPRVMVTDGPHGLRKQSGEADHLGLNDSVPATCFPAGSALACSWDKNLIQSVGVALGEECQQENVGVLLGPAVNIKRSPLCGRNFEYFSEDPYLSSQMAKHHILGVQSQGIGTSIKHFAANNQEHKRMSIDTLVDERTMREIYLASFEDAIVEAEPWTVMCAYNKVNGTYAGESQYLLNDVLRNDWGYKGFVVSDWGAVNDRVEGVRTGLELEMPGNGGFNDIKIVQAVKSGQLDEQILDRAVERILGIVFKTVDHNKVNFTCDKEQHHGLARKVAGETAVLLQNHDDILPIAKSSKVAIIGDFAKHPRYQGGGSSHVNPTKIENAYDEIVKLIGADQVTYTQGFSQINDVLDEAAFDEALQNAKEADMAIVFAGLPERYESEGFDRTNMDMPAVQNELIEALSEVQGNIVVVLSNGSPIEMPWRNRVKGILECYLGGQASGGAAADLLFGDVNPSGKLAETFPEKMAHNPSHLNFPGEDNVVAYQEGIFVGYRYYDLKQIEPMFPFGHGLSYTKFEYTDIEIDRTEMKDTDIVTVKVNVRNAGSRKGKEVVQLYIRDVESTVNRPSKELRGFEKIELEAGEEQTVEFKLSKRDFAYYNVAIADWHVESGDFEVLIGSSVSDIRLSAGIKVQSTIAIRKTFHMNSTIGELMMDPMGSQVAEKMLAGFMENSEMGSSDMADANPEMMEAMMRYMPLRNLMSFSAGQMTEEMLQGILMQINGQV